jgi:hypothetical protein
MGPATSYTPSSVSMVDGDTMQILFNSGVLPDESCYVINIGPGTLAQVIIGDTDCAIRSLLGDVNNSGTVTSADMLLVKSKVSPPTPATTVPNCDVNLSNNNITSADMLLIKSRVTTPVKTALCP